MKPSYEKCARYKDAGKKLPRKAKKRFKRECLRRLVEVFKGALLYCAPPVYEIKRWP